VEILLMNREFPVDRPTTEIFFRAASLDRGWTSPMCRRFRALLRLIARSRGVQFVASPDSTLLSDTVAADVHRYQESIAGRSYLIEVRPVSTDRWRAYIVRIPGVPTALMPFYGETPAEAARQLCDWLTRAHKQAAPPPRSA
jgi:hypothetical protein